jgi:hypothetical protein
MELERELALYIITIIVTLIVLIIYHNIDKKREREEKYIKKRSKDNEFK